MYVEWFKSLNDRSSANFHVFYLDITSWKWNEWKLNEPGVVSVPWYDACTAVVEDKIFRFAGVSATDANYRKMHCLDLPMQEITVRNSVNEDLMPARRFTAAFVESRDLIVAFGGAKSATHLSPTDNLVGYNVKTSTWQNLDAQGSGPSARIDLSCCAVGKHSVFFFGGLDLTGEMKTDMYQLVCGRATFRWTRISMLLPSRYLHVMCCVGQRIYVFGGYRENQADPNRDMFLYDTGKRRRVAVEFRESGSTGEEDVDKKAVIGLTGELPENASFSVVTSNKMMIFMGGRYSSDEVFVVTGE